VTVASREIRISRKTLYQGRILDLFVDQVRVPGRGQHVREVVDHRPAVGVVPCLPDGNVLLVRQFRYAVGRALWEIPAGLMNPGETPRSAARRELAEETGYQAGRLTLLADVFSSPGFCRERVVLFLGLALRRIGRPQPDPDEILEMRSFSRDRVQAWMRKNRVRDAKTLLGLQLAAHKIGRV
jgi:ADP-ribose pyrophosphatase